ncbi:MAG: Mobile element protein, partial [Candidatus Midichloriaceae bacterium]|nr:Mobile element protein [Candidatus Midichloriaceae bacterium]
MQTQSLKNILCIFLGWHPARIQTYCELIFGIIEAKTVTIKELAKQVSSCGRIGAKIAKVERLFAKQVVDYTAIGQIIIKLLGGHKKWRIAIDRTNWQF